MASVNEVISLLVHEVDVDKIRVTDVRVGVFYTGVKLSTGHGGVAFTPIYDISEAVCCPKSFGKMPIAGELSNRPLAAVAEYASSNNTVEATIGVAALNAISQKLLFESSRRDVAIASGADALQLADVRREDKVAMVGAFTPYVKKLKGNVARLDIIERNPKAAGEVATIAGAPERTSTDALREADVIVVTGSAIVNQTIDSVLALAKKARERIVVGPTASLLPQPFFKRGVTVMGGLRILDADCMLNIVGEAGGAYALMKRCAEKYAATPRAAASSQ